MSKTSVSRSSHAKKFSWMEINVSQETYLFKAACSELKTEVQNSRKLNDEKIRRERTLLEHEVEILNQKLTQDLTQMRDELKGLFDDRRMTVRMEQRNMDAAVRYFFSALFQIQSRVPLKLN